MRRRGRRPGGPADEAIPWIAYTDLLVSLAAVYVLASLAGSGHPPRAGSVRLQLAGRVGSVPVTGCPVVVRGLSVAISDTTGMAKFLIDSLIEPTQLGVHIQCEGYDPAYDLLTVRPGDTVVRTVRLEQTGLQTVQSIPGDALFGSGSFVLKPEGVRRIIEALSSFRLGSGEMVKVRGHTDDIPFDGGLGRDNWMLSGERAAAAARILIDSLRIEPCQVVVEGVGPYLPSQPVDTQADPREVQIRKRALNRRIEFLRVAGAGRTVAGCLRLRK